MRNFLVKTPLGGLTRADGRKLPVPADDVVALPEHIYRGLEASGAIVATDQQETLALVWPDLSDSRSPFPTPPIAVVAVTDSHALVAAISDLGGIVFFVGEGLPDDAEDVLADFSNDQMLDEITARIGEGRLAPTLLGGLIDISAGPDGVLEVIEQTDDVGLETPKAAPDSTSPDLAALKPGEPGAPVVAPAQEKPVPKPATSKAKSPK